MMKPNRIPIDPNHQLESNLSDFEQILQLHPVNEESKVHSSTNAELRLELQITTFLFLYPSNNAALAVKTMAALM